MRRRYKNIPQDSLSKALGKLRAAFLTPKNTKQVETIIYGILTHDERMKIGRRIQIAEMLLEGETYYNIAQKLNVGQTTIINVARQVGKSPECYKLIVSKEVEIKRKIKKKRNSKKGSSTLIFKKRAYSEKESLNVNR